MRAYMLALLSLVSWATAHAEDKTYTQDVDGIRIKFAAPEAWSVTPGLTTHVTSPHVRISIQMLVAFSLKAIDNAMSQQMLAPGLRCSAVTRLAGGQTIDCKDQYGGEDTLAVFALQAPTQTKTAKMLALRIHRAKGVTAEERAGVMRLQESLAAGEIPPEPAACTPQSALTGVEKGGLLRGLHLTKGSDALR